MDSSYIKCIIGIIVIFAILGCIFSLFGGDGSTEVYVNDVKFHIPSGFEENPSIASQHQIMNNGVKYDVKAYDNEAGDNIVITVSDLKDDTIDSVDNLKNQGYEGKSIHGKDGVIQYIYGEPQFLYVENGKFIGIDSTDESLIDKVID